MYNLFMFYTVQFKMLNVGKNKVYTWVEIGRLHIKLMGGN